MFALGLLIALVLYVGLAWMMAKLIGRYTDSKIARYLLIAIVVLIPTWDIIPGRLYFQYLCEREAGVKVLKTVEVASTYFLPNDQPDEKKLADLYTSSMKVEREFSRLFHIMRIQSFIHDKRTEEVLGIATDLSYYGGWLAAHLFPQGPPTVCPYYPVHSLKWKEVIRPKRDITGGAN